MGVAAEAINRLAMGRRWALEATDEAGSCDVCSVRAEPSTGLQGRQEHRSPLQYGCAAISPVLVHFADLPPSRGRFAAAPPGKPLPQRRLFYDESIALRRGSIVGWGGLRANLRRRCPLLILRASDVDAAGILDEAFAAASA